ncbi:putative S-layer protein [Alkalihalophilus pseudofirmus OF4]|uniref:S-layer protein n=1 Tax=Alkalihalophilus pseudofirmus (strain ATCC BAA-2126 / JCM 17055 / OF4) TaxID=398511 RepID=D3FZK4_ALKPO|nr:S-layer homology domain-containing protein [Alkalihalophilus pseudofirmus]ADC49246.1 putative S-layer protein [Alkalihalophilus pseudofirmus OF4]
MKIKIGFIVLVILLIVPFGVQAQSLFKDVPESHWGTDEIRYLAEEGIVTGTGGGNFSPQAPVTRAQVAVMLSRTLNLGGEAAKQPSYKDIDEETFGYHAISVLTERGVFADGEAFHPMRSITRAEMARVIAEAFELTGQNEYQFADVERNHWAAPSVRAIAKNGVMAGNLQAQFLPSQPMTRAEFSASLARAINEEFKIDADSIIEESIIRVAKSNVEKLEEIFRSPELHGSPRAQYSTIRPEVANYGTTSYAYGHLYRHYQQMCSNCDEMLYGDTSGFHVRAEAAAFSVNSVRVETIILGNELHDPKFFTIEMRPDDGKYKIHQSNLTAVEGAGFDLTHEETEKAVQKFAGSYYTSSVTHLQLVNISSHEPYNYEKHDYQVTLSNGESHYVTVDTRNGFITY